MVTFSDLKFSSGMQLLGLFNQKGTFPNLIRLKFRATVTVTIGSNKYTKTIESPQTKPFISMTNTGSQWKDAAGTWLKEDCFGDSYEVPLPWFWNYFQKHFLIATKQDPQSAKRCLNLHDFAFMIQVERISSYLTSLGQVWTRFGEDDDQSKRTPTTMGLDRTLR